MSTEGRPPSTHGPGQVVGALTARRADLILGVLIRVAVVDVHPHSFSFWLAGRIGTPGR